MGGGLIPLPVMQSNVIDYITIASTGDAVDFGDLYIWQHNKVTGGGSSHKVL